MIHEEKVVAGLDFLALFSPRQVDCIIAAVQGYGMDLPIRVEEHQVDNAYVNNPFGCIDPTVCDHKTRAAIGRTLGLVWRDAMTKEWSEDDYVKMLVASTGCSESMAKDVAKAVPTNETATFTRAFMNSVADALTLGLGRHIAGFIDDLIDSSTGAAMQDNLYEFYKLGLSIEDLMLRAKLMKLEDAFEKSGGAVVDVTELQSTDIPETMKAIIATMLATQAAQAKGKTESGEPYTAEQGDPDMQELDDLLQEGARLMTQRIHSGAHMTAEQGGWLGDALGFVGKAAKKVVGISKKLGKRIVKGVTKGGKKGVLGEIAGTTLGVPGAFTAGKLIHGKIKGHHSSHAGRSLGPKAAQPTLVTGAQGLLATQKGYRVPRNVKDIQIILQLES